MTLGEIISEYRREHGLSMRGFAKLCGLSVTYISAIERGSTQRGNSPAPSVDVYKRIASAMNMELTELLARIDGAAEPVPLSPAGSPGTRDIDGIYDALNAEGRQQLIRYGRFLTTQDEYRAQDEKPQIEYIRHYLTAAAAGYAAPIEGEDYELIPRPANAPANADFCVDITGDSMEPYIHDGQRVYVKRDAPLSDFDVGIFYVDGDVYCKQFCPGIGGQLYLLSANPKRRDANIILTSTAARNVVCFGRVIIKKLPAPVYTS